MLCLLSSVSCRALSPPFSLFSNLLTPLLICSESAEARDARLTAYGLYLLWLLCESRLADFHAVVELLSAEDRASAYVAFSLRLEAFMMEGSYNKVLAARGVVPSQTYLPFLSKLEGTVREEVADVRKRERGRGGEACA